MREIPNHEFQIREIQNPEKPFEGPPLIEDRKKGSVQRSKIGLFTFFDNLHWIIAFDRFIITYQKSTIVFIEVIGAS